MSTHELCFSAKIRIAYPCRPQFYYMKVGYKEGLHYMDMFAWLQTLVSLC